MLKTLLIRFKKDESGATAIEYGLIAALISVVIILAVTAVGGGLRDAFTEIACSLDDATTVDLAIAGFTCP